MSKYAHEPDSSKRKLASLAEPVDVHGCRMSEPPFNPPSWFAHLYPSVDASPFDHYEERRRAVQDALKIDNATADKNREWINRIISILRTTPTNLAREAGLTPSTINRFLKQVDSPANISASTMAAIMSAAERMIYKLYGEDGSWDNFVGKMSHVAQHLGASGFSKALREVKILSNVEAGKFRNTPSLEYEEKNSYQIKVPVSAAHRDRPVFGIDYFTTRSGHTLCDEDILIAVPLWISPYDFDEGDRLIVNRFEPGVGIETTLREVISDGRGVHWLVGVDQEADILAPLPLGRKPFRLSSDNFVISFLVIGHYHWAW